MTKGEVKAQFLDLLNNSIVRGKPSLVETFITQAILRIQRELRVPFMEKVIEYTIPSNFMKLAIPADLLALVSLMVDTDNDGIYDYQLQRVDMGRVARASQETGVPPQIFARKGGDWLVGPRPGPGSKIEITYYASFTPLADDNASNTLTMVAWDAVVYGALSAACDYLDDDRFEKYEGRYVQIVNTLQEQADADELTADAAVRPALSYDDGYED
jgi:hypothetical protein